jgi:hypothetical protein
MVPVEPLNRTKNFSHFFGPDLRRPVCEVMVKGLRFSQEAAECPGMKSLLAALVALAGAAVTCAQEAELPPVVVTGTFELAPRRSRTDVFSQHLLKQFETRRALEEAVARAPWYYSRMWDYAPIQLQSTFDDSAKFFTPRYLTTEYQQLDQALRKSEKQSLFAR